MMYQKINCTINDMPYTFDVDVRSSLLEVLRNELGFVGSKEGCGVGECGACTIILDGETVDSCIYLAVWADGKNIKTIEGVTRPDGNLSDVQEHFIKAGAVQCGFCIPGFVMSATNLLDHNPTPTEEEIRRGMSGNLCRCTGYQKIVDAVENVVKERHQTN